MARWCTLHGNWSSRDYCPLCFPKLADVLPDFGKADDARLSGTAKVMDAIAASNAAGDGGAVRISEGIIDDRVMTLTGFSVFGTDQRLERHRSAMRVAIANLEATELAGLPSIAHVIRSLKDALNG